MKIKISKERRVVIAIKEVKMPELPLFYKPIYQTCESPIVTLESIIATPNKKPSIGSSDKGIFLQINHYCVDLDYGFYFAMVFLILILICITIMII